MNLNQLQLLINYMLLSEHGSAWLSESLYWLGITNNNNIALRFPGARRSETRPSPPLAAKE
jgi:hypothetical protein